VDVLTCGAEIDTLLSDKLLELGAGGRLTLVVLTWGTEIVSVLIDTETEGLLTAGALTLVVTAGCEIETLLIDTPEPEGITESVLVEVAGNEVGAPMTLAAKSTPELVPMPVMLFFR